MKLTRLLSGLAPALAAAVFIGLAAPAAIAQNNAPAAAPATEAAPAAAAPAAPAAPAPRPRAGAGPSGRGSGAPCRACGRRSSSPRAAPKLLGHGDGKVHRQF